MKKIIITILSIFFLGSTLHANEDLLNLFHLAVEHKDVKLVQEVIQALLQLEDNNKNLLDALAKYSEKGKVDFALHNAIKDKNVLASVILTHYSKNLNTRKPGFEYVWTSNNGAVGRINKSPIELTLEADMIGLIPYLLMKKADPYPMSEIGFLYPEDENPDYLLEFAFAPQKKNCTKSKRDFFAFQGSFKRNLVGCVICKDRLDVIEILQKSSIDLNKICCEVNGMSFTPLQFALAIKRYEIVQFLIDNGARIE